MVIENCAEIIALKPAEKIKLITDGSIYLIRTRLWLYVSENTTNNLGNYYIENRQKQIESDSKIIKDVSRTYPGELFFQNASNQMKMFHVTKVYCLYDDVIGYCQGMCFPVGAILKFFDEINAFNIIYYLFVELKMRFIFDVEKGTSKRASIKFMEVLSKELPKVFKKFISLDYDLDILMVPWLLTFTGTFFNLISVTDVLDLILLFGPTSIFNLLLAIMHFCSDDLLNLASSAEIHSFFRYKLLDIFLNNRGSILKTFSQIIVKDKFVGIYESLEKISNSPKQTTINELVNIPKLQGNALNSLVDKLTNISLCLIYENNRLKTELSSGNPPNSSESDSKDGFYNSTVKKNPFLTELKTDCNVCKVKEHDLSMIIESLKKYSDSTFKMAHHFKEILDILRSSQIEGIKNNSMNPYKLYEDLIDSSTVEIKSKIDVINLERDLMDLQSDFLHHMKKLNESNQ